MIKLELGWNDDGEHIRWRVLNTLNTKSVCLFPVARSLQGIIMPYLEPNPKFRALVPGNES